MKFSKIAITCLLIFLVSVAVTFVAITLITEAASESQSQQEPQMFRTSSVADAETLAGYPLASPKFPDESFQRVDTITVYERSSTKKDTDLIQHWIKKSGSITVGWVEVHQSPVVTGLFASQKETLNGYPIQRVVFPSVEGRPYGLVHLYWRDGNMAYMVLASLTGGITEKDAEYVLISLQ